MTFSRNLAAVLVSATIFTLAFAEKDFKNANLVTFLNNSARYFRDELIDTPIEFDEATEVTINNADYILDGTISKVRYPGISAMRAYYIDGDLTYNKIHMEAEFPSGIYLGNFELRGHALRNQSSFGGTGNFSISPSYSPNMWFSHSVRFDVVDNFIKVRDPYAYLSDSSLITANFSGLFNGTENISETLKAKIVTDVGNLLRDAFRREVQLFLREKLTAQIQIDFDQVSLPDILAGVTLPPRTTTVGCVYTLSDALSQWGHELVLREGNETVISSNVVGVENGQVVMEIVTKKTVIISTI